MLRSGVVTLRYFKIHTITWFFFASFLPMLFSITWLIKNTQLPTSDPANFLATSADIYHHFITQGFWDGVQSCYLVRGWRPIFFPVLLVPFLLVAQGNLLLAYSLFALLCVLLTSMAVYSFFRLEIEAIPAVIATNLVGLLPMVEVQILGFYAESILFPCLIASVYFLIKSNYLQNIKASFAFSLLFAFAFILRPIETVMLMVFVLSVFFYLGCRQRVFKFSQVIMIFALGFIALYEFIKNIQFYMSHTPNQVNSSEFQTVKLAFHISSIGSIVLTSLTACLLLFQIRKKVPRHFLIIAFLLILSIVFCWFYGFAFETFHWIYQTSLGDVAAGTTRITGSAFQIWPEINMQTQAEGRLVVLSCLALAGLTSIYFLAKRKLRELYSQPMMYLLLMIPFPWIEVIFTVQDINRKLSVAFPALIMALLIISLKHKENLVLRTSIASVILGLQLIIFWLASFGNYPLNLTLNNTIGYYLRPPVMINPNPHEAVKDFLTVEAEKNKINYIALEVNPYTIDPVDPFLLTMMVNASYKSYSVSYPYFETFSPNNPKSMAENIPAVFLSDNINRMKVTPDAAKEYYKRYTNEKAPSTKTLYEFLYYYSNNQLADIGWRVRACVTIKSACLVFPVESGIRKDDCLGCLLLPIKNKNYTKE